MRLHRKNQFAHLLKKTEIIFYCFRAIKIIAPIFILFEFYCYLSFLSLPQKLPDSLHFLALVIFIALCVVFLISGIKKSQKITKARCVRSIEHASLLPKYSLQAFIDRPAHVAYTSHALWQYHKMRSLQQLPKLNAFTFSVTPYGFFLSVTLCLLLGANMIEYEQSQPYANAQILSGLLPGYDDPKAPYPPIDVSLKAPPWDNGPIISTQEAVKTFQIAQSTQLRLFVHNIATAPYLTINGKRYNGIRPATLGNKEGWVIIARIQQSGHAFIHGRGRVLSHYDFIVRPDPPTHVDWQQTPTPITHTDWTSFSIKASHPFGIASYGIIFSQPNDSNHRYKSFSWDAKEHPLSLKKHIFIDLTHYRWAQNRIKVQLTAKSISGENGYSSAMVFHPNYPVLTSPTARHLCKIRDEYEDTPQENVQIAKQLRQLVIEDPIISRKTSYIVNALYCAMLMDSQDPSDPPDIQKEQRSKAQDLLWNLARDIQKDSQAHKELNNSEELTSPNMNAT